MIQKEARCKLPLNATEDEDPACAAVPTLSRMTARDFFFSSPFCVQMQWLIFVWRWKNLSIHILLCKDYRINVHVFVAAWSVVNLFCSCHHRVHQRLLHNAPLDSWGCDRLRLLCSGTGSGQHPLFTEKMNCRRVSKIREKSLKPPGKTARCVVIGTKRKGAMENWIVVRFSEKVKKVATLLLTRLFIKDLSSELNTGLTIWWWWTFFSPLSTRGSTKICISAYSDWLGTDMCKWRSPGFEKVKHFFRKCTGWATSWIWMGHHLWLWWGLILNIKLPLTWHMQ